MNIRKLRGSRAGLAGVCSSASVGIATLVAGILLFPLIIAVTGPEKYGVWLLLMALANYFQYADLGVGAAIVHYGSRWRGGVGRYDLARLLAAGLLWNGAVAVVVIPAYVVAAIVYVGSTSHTAGMTDSQATVLIVAGTVATGTLIVRPFSSALIAAGQLPVERMNQACGLLVRTVGTLAVCISGGGIVEISVVESVAAVVPFALSGWAIASGRLARVSWDWNETCQAIRLMTSYSLKSFGVSAVGALILQGGTIFAGLTLSPAAVTYFNAAFRVYSGIRQILTWIIDPFRSSLSRLYVEDISRYKELVLALSRSSVIVTTVSCVALTIMADTVIRGWLGPRFPISQIAITVTVLLFSLVLNSFHIALVPAADAAGSPGIFLAPQLVWLGSFAAIALLLGPRIGIAGIGLALALPLAYVEPLYFLRARRSVPIPCREWRQSVFIPTFVAVAPGILAAAAAYFTLSTPDWRQISSAAAAVAFISTTIAWLTVRRNLLFEPASRLVTEEL